MSARGQGRGGFSRGGMVQTQRSNHGRKPCPQGLKCPYIDEYQHPLEFSHDHGGVSASSNSNKRNFDAFSGPGHRLGTSSGQEMWWMDDDRAIVSGGDGFSLQSFGGPISSLPDDPDTFYCDQCSRRFPLVALDNHHLIHSSSAAGSTSAAGNANSLREEQDRAYEKSVLEEIMKKTAEEAAAAKKAEEERQAQQQKELRQFQAESLRESAKSSLLPEPVNSLERGKTVAIRFMMPSGTKLVRKFDVDDILAQMRFFLLCQEELFMKTFILRGLRQEDVIDFRKTLAMQGPPITENSAFTVVLQDDNDDGVSDVVVAPPTAQQPSPATAVSVDKGTTSSSDRLSNKHKEIISLLDSAEKPPASKRPRNNDTFIDLT